MCLYHVFLLFVSLSVLLKFLKHVKLVFECKLRFQKTKHLFLIKKVVARFDKNSGIAEKREESDDPREESITADPEEKPITEHS